MKIRNACRLNGVIISSSTEVRIIVFIHIIINYSDQEANEWTHDCYWLTVLVEIESRLTAAKLGDWLHLNYTAISSIIGKMWAYYRGPWSDAISLLQRDHQYCAAANLELLHILHHPARETLHESIFLQLHFPPNKLPFTRVCTNQIPSSACWVKVQLGRDKSSTAMRSVWLLCHDFRVKYLRIDVQMSQTLRAFNQNTVRSKPMAVVPPEPSKSGKWDLKSLRGSCSSGFVSAFYCLKT